MVKDPEWIGLVASRPALVPLVSGAGKVSLKFIDCIATYSDARDVNFPNGYGNIRTDKYGTVHKSYSEVAAYVGGAIGVTVYPQQFGLTATLGIPFRFWAGPEEILEACVQAVREELHPPEYAI